VRYLSLLWPPKALSCFLAFLFLPLSTLWPTNSLTSVPPVPNSCSRFPAGAVVRNPPALFSQNGYLSVRFSYQTRTDDEGRTLFSFMTPDGLENPTLYVHPGDHLIVTITNNTPATPIEMPAPPPTCGGSVMTHSSVNIHFHGTNTSPVCDQDEVVHTIINSGETFQYNLVFPLDEPPGVYWYHPHAHGLTEAALQGGASGAIVVEGIQRFHPEVAGLRQRVLLIRDQNVAGNPTPGGKIPSWDLSLNFVPIAYPAEVPAILRMRSGNKEFWRVVNASADSLVDLQVLFDGVPQVLKIVGLDGVPVNSQDGQPGNNSSTSKPLDSTHVLLPTAGRAEFIVEAPAASVKVAELLTRKVNTGPDGDNDTRRTVASIQTVTADDTLENDALVSNQSEPDWQPRFQGLATAAVTNRRHLFFSENNPKSLFFITVEGEKRALYNPANPPAIVTTQGSVEDWIVENRTLENHEFHLHQTHFLVLSQDNFALNGTEPDRTIEGQYLDTIQVPYWDGNPDHPYPKVKVRVDFRGPDIGDFVYHCHIAEHEDGGMMAIIRVLPFPGAAAPNRAASLSE
jgi:FtsP/CotA-like multicopper oxidase with cupredoxin domain